MVWQKRCLLAARRKIYQKVFALKRFIIYLLLLSVFSLKGQTKLYLDSMLKEAYIARYPFSEGLTCIPFYCDPFYASKISNADTSMCGKFVFVNKNFEVKIRPVFELPCNFEPRFSEGLCAVNIKNQIVFIDTTGVVKINTGLAACSSQRNRVSPFQNGRARITKASSGNKPYTQVYYIDRQGKRLPEKLYVKVKPKDKPIITIIAAIPVKPRDTFKPVFDLPRVVAKNHYHVKPEEAKILLKTRPHKDNRMLLYYECGSYQMEQMASADTIYCGKFVFTDTLFDVKISSGFKLPCAFEPEFSEGLCAVAIDSQIVYIDTIGRVVIRTGLASCNKELNKASTFKNGIATLYKGDPKVPGLYTTIAINSVGERVRLLEFDDLDLAEKLWMRFSNVTAEESAGCFIGRGKTNGYWFLVEKSGKVRKKLVLK